MDCVNYIKLRRPGRAGLDPVARIRIDLRQHSQRRTRLHKEKLRLLLLTGVDKAFNNQQRRVVAAAAAAASLNFYLWAQKAAGNHLVSFLLLF